MSRLIYFAAYCLLEAVENPHERYLSVNEALCMGVDVSETLLAPHVDRNIPNKELLWCDRSVMIDVDRQTIEDGNFDDDLCIVPTDQAWDDIYTDKEYMAYLDWGRITPGRAKRVIEYIRQQLQRTEEVELWNIYMGCESRPKIHKWRVPIDTLTADEIYKLENADVYREPFEQFCLVIRR